MVPLAQWSRDLDASAVYKRLRDNFGACCKKEALYVTYGKAMAHLCSQSVKIDPSLLSKFSWDYWEAGVVSFAMHSWLTKMPTVR